MPAIRFSGLASGIDADAVIEALTDAKGLQKVPIENKIQQNEDENSGLEELNTLMLSLKDSMNDFLTLSGGAISKKGSSSNEDIATVSVSTNAPTSSTTISSVSQLASSATFTFDDRFTEYDQPLAPGLTAPETMIVSVGTGSDQVDLNIAIDDETTLDEVAIEINEQGDGKVVASIINLGDDQNPQYTLLLNTQNTGTAEGALAVSVPPALQNEGLFTSYQEQAAQDAIFTIAGLGQVTKSSNQVSGLIPGISFELKQASLAPVTLNVSNDTDGTIAKIEEMVGKFNEIVAYSSSNSEISVETGESGNNVNLYGTMARTRVDENMVGQIKGALATSFSDIESSAVKIFADMGIVTGRNGELEIKMDKLTEAINGEPTSVAQILNQFADNVASTGGIVDNYTRFNGLIDLAVQANDSENDSYSDQLQRIDRSMQALEDRLRRTFTNLESEVGRLNAGSAALTSALAGLG